MEYVLVIFELVLIIITLVLMCSILINIVKRRSPFVSSPRHVFDVVYENLDIKEGDNVFDLGCGDAKALNFFYSKQPKAKYFGYELSLLPFLLAKLKTFGRGGDIKVIKKDFTKADISGADKIYLYLLPRVMNEILPKLEKELKTGTIVVSCDFEFSNKKPDEIVDLKDAVHKWLGKRVFVYKF